MSEVKSVKSFEFINLRFNFINALNTASIVIQIKHTSKLSTFWNCSGVGGAY